MDLLGFFSVMCLLCLCARLFICALWSPAGKGLTSWLSFVMFNYDVVTFPLVSWVRCGTRLYRFLIFTTLTYLKTYLLMRWPRPDALAVVRPTRVYLLDFFCFGFSFIYC